MASSAPSRGRHCPTVADADTSDGICRRCGDQRLQTVLANGAAGQWLRAPQAINATFGPDTQASVEAFQT
jgi:hypothetical protein